MALRLCAPLRTASAAPTLPPRRGGAANRGAAAPTTAAVLVLIFVGDLERLIMREHFRFFSWKEKNRKCGRLRTEREMIDARTFFPILIYIFATFPYHIAMSRIKTRALLLKDWGGRSGARISERIGSDRCASTFAFLAFVAIKRLLYARLSSLAFCFGAARLEHMPRPLACPPTQLTKCELFPRQVPVICGEDFVYDTKW